MNTRRPDLNLLATLEVLLAERNVTRAATRLRLSQPAVSAQLARLRELFDDPLLVPAQRGMTPTAKALELAGPLREALDRVRDVVAHHRDFDPGRAELTASVACSDYLQVAVVKPLVRALRQQAPGMRLAVRQLDQPQLAAQMARGEVDLAFLRLQIAPPELRLRRLFDERYVLIGRAGHRRLRKGMTLEAFAELDHVIVSPSGGGFATPVDEALAAAGLRRRVVLSAASFLSVPDLVAESEFVALVPQRLVAGGADRLKVMTPPFPVQGFTVGMVWHERNHGHPAQRWLRETVVAITET